MDKKQTAIYKMTDHWDDDYITGTPEDRIGLVWPLTREIASLSVKHDVERRLQRHVTCLVRREG
jgi:dTDP-4-dehydrorhamnose 3,5-epimerase-like enzyme